MKAVLVTGATGKLGRVFVENLLECGYVVVATGRTESKLQELKEGLGSGANNLACFCHDHYDEGFLQSLSRFLDEIQLNVFALINNVRDLSNIKNLEPSEESWQREFYLGVVLPYNLTIQLAQAGFLSRVINVSSMYGSVVPNLGLYKSNDLASPIHYGVVKAAQNKLTKELAVRLASQQVAVNAIAYGGIDGRVDEDFRGRYQRLCPAGRMLQENDIFSTVKYLLSDASKMLTGEVLHVDGGWSLW